MILKTLELLSRTKEGKKFLNGINERVNGQKLIPAPALTKAPAPKPTGYNPPTPKF